MRISDWSSDVCSSDLNVNTRITRREVRRLPGAHDPPLDWPRPSGRCRGVIWFIDENQPPFMIEATDIGQQEREKRRIGAKLKKNAGELTIVDFMSSDDGLPKYLRPGDPVAIPHRSEERRVGKECVSKCKSRW